MPDEYLLPFILAIAGLGAGLLVAVSSLAVFRRRSLPYVLVTLAIGTLLLRSFLGTVMLGGLVSGHSHHFLEHVLDVLVVGLLFTAVHTARRIEDDTLTKPASHDPDE